MTKNNDSATTIGFEDQLWRAADTLRSNMDAAEYKHVVLGLIFLKYISDAFEEQHARLEAERGLGADPEDPDEYRAVNIFWCSRKRAGPASRPMPQRAVRQSILLPEPEAGSAKRRAD